MARGVSVCLVVVIGIIGAGSGPAEGPVTLLNPDSSDSSRAPGEVQVVTLDELLAEALEHNRALLAAADAVAAKEASVIPASTLPDPLFTVQTMGEPAPFDLMAGDPSSARVFGIQQDIPFPGKLRLRGKIAEKEAEAAFWNYEQTRRKVIADLKQAYYELSFTDSAIETLEKNKNALQTVARLAETRYRLGQGLQLDLLKAQLEVSKLLERQIEFRQRRAAAAARVNSITGRPAGTPVGRAVPVQGDKASVAGSLEELLEAARQNSPTLKERIRQVERSQYEV